MRLVKLKVYLPPEWTMRKSNIHYLVNKLSHTFFLKHVHVAWYYHQEHNFPVVVDEREIYLRPPLAHLSNCQNANHVERLTKRC